MPKDHLAALSLGIMAMLFISPDALLIRLVDAEAELSLGARGLLVGISVLLFSIFANARRGRAASALMADVPVKVAYGVSFTVGFTFFTLAVTHTNVFNVLVIIMTAPIVSAVGAHFLRGERVDASLWAVSALVMACVATILWSDIGGGHIWGDLAAFGVTFSLAFNANLVRHNRGTDTIAGLALGGLLVAAIFLPQADFGTLGERDWVWLGLNGMFLMPSAVILLNFASKRLPPPEVNLLFIIEMVVSPLWIWAFLGEVPKATVLAAGVTAGAILVAYYTAKLRGMRRGGVTLE